MQQVSGIREVVKDFILTEFLPGEDPDELTESTSLLTSGVLDSLNTMRLITFLEERFRVEIQPHEIGAEHFGTVASIADLVQSKSQG